MEGEDYWNKSENKAFSFDEDDRVSVFKMSFTRSNKPIHSVVRRQIRTFHHRRNENFLTTTRLK